jgi:hypothetical protein
LRHSSSCDVADVAPKENQSHATIARPSVAAFYAKWLMNSPATLEGGKYLFMGGKGATRLSNAHRFIVLTPVPSGDSPIRVNQFSRKFF